MRQLPKERFEELRRYLEQDGFSFEERPYQAFLARKEGAVVSLYLNGKVLLTGADEDAIGTLVAAVDQLGASEVRREGKELGPLEVSGTRIGTDEVGKGDYFGPLVVAGVLVAGEIEAKLRAIGVKDSKKLADTSITNKAIEIRKIVGGNSSEVIWISPLKYNLLYEKLRNVNRILGWAHARAIENLLGNGIACERAVADQFGDQSYIQNALMKKGRKIDLLQVPKAERDVAVAAASILARDVFIAKLEEMRESYLLDFPKGATNVVEFGRKLVETHGIGVLQNVAKLHFGTTREITGGTVPVVKEEVGNAANLEVVPRQVSERDLQESRLELFNLISNFEEEFRRFMGGKLEAHFGNDWWMRCVESSVRKKCEGRQAAETKKGRKVELVDCLDFEHYWMILTTNENWDQVFKKIFRDKTKLQARLTILKDVRDPVSHARGSFGAKEKAETVAAINHLRRMMRQLTELDEFETATTPQRRPP